MAPGLVAARKVSEVETAELNPRIVPSSVAKMNVAGAEVVPSVIMKFELAFDTAPVGALATGTAARAVVPSARYTVETSIPLSATHQGERAVEVRPQALTRLESVFGATPETSETRL